MKWLMLVVLLCVLSPQVLAAPEWTLAVDDDGIQIYLRDYPGSDIQEFKAVVTIDATLDSIMAVFSDVASCPHWFHRCKNPALVAVISFTERVNYQASAFPFPADDRDSIIITRISQDAVSKAITMDMQAAPDYCVTRNTPSCVVINAADFVRMRVLTVQYVLQPTEQGVVMRWQQHTEPGGRLPNWLVNQLLVELPLNSLKALRKIVKEDKYRTSKLQYSPDGVAIGFAIAGWH